MFPSQLSHEQTARKPRHKQKGFTLIEVLVALAIIAVAISAAARVSGVVTQGNGILRDKSIALLAAQSRMAELRLEGQLTPGLKSIDCDQGRLKLRCEQNISSNINQWMSSVTILVFDRSRVAPPLARLDTLVTRTLKNPEL